MSRIALAGSKNVTTLTARDAAGNTAIAVLTVMRNVAPTLASISDQSTEAGRFASVQLSGNDADGDVLTYGANGLPPGMALTVSSGVISGTPTEAGTYSVTASVFDGVQSAARTFTWTVTADATAPIVTITAPTTAATYVSNASSVTLSGTATDNIGVTQVSWLNNRGGSGVAAGTSNWITGAIALQSGVNALTVTARDAAGNTTTATLSVTLNAAPVLASIPSRSAPVGVPTTMQLVATDADGDALTYSATGLPSGLVVAAGTGIVSGTPTVAGNYFVTASVSDGVHSASQTFIWTITPDVTAPTVTITVPTSEATYAANATTVALSGTATDAVGVTTVSWASNRGARGIATGTTTWSLSSIPLQPGQNTITVTARDAAGNTGTDVITVKR